MQKKHYIFKLEKKDLLRENFFVTLIFNENDRVAYLTFHANQAITE